MTENKQKEGKAGGKGSKLIGESGNGKVQGNGEISSERQWDVQGK